jgi:Cu-Zn family superoxide dismutase
MLLATDAMEAWLAFVTTRFTVRDIIGRSVVIHMNRDDYTSQPAGDSGQRIGCGVIRVL